MLTELCYIWIGDYGLLKEQDINLGGGYIFKYEKNKLKINKNSKYFPDFW